MKSNTKYSIKNQLITDNGKSLCPCEDKSNQNFVSHRDILFNSKYSLETLLNFIKKNLFDLISTKKINNNNDSNKNKIKQTLFNLINNLKSLLDEKNKNYNNIKNLNKAYKTKLNENLFPYNETTQYSSDKNLNSELEQLKDLNFEIINKIQNVDFLIKRNNDIIKSYSNNKQEISYESDKRNDVTVFFQDKMQNINSNFNLIYVLNEQNEIKKEKLSEQISHLKNQIKEQKNINNAKTEPNNCNPNNHKSFHSSRYTNNSLDDYTYVLNIEEENTNKLASFNATNDDINTDNSNYHSKQNISKERHNIQSNQDENFIFGNSSTKDE